ncbi:MAG TPA: GtrA family protein [Actinomycetota bacterium]|nr:GtrA family protein [Actinomycetota bacterium]
MTDHGNVVDLTERKISLADAAGVPTNGSSLNGHKSGRFGRLFRFAAVGITGLVVNQLALWAGTDGLGVHYVFSAILATQLSTAWNFALSEWWVFKAERSGRWKRLFWFAVMNNAWLAARVPFLFVLTEWAGLHYLLSNFIALAASTVARFAIADTWIWSGRGSGPLGSAGRTRTTYKYDIHGIVRVSSEARLPELTPFLVPSLENAVDLEVTVKNRGLGGFRRRALVEHRGETVRYAEHLGALGFAMKVEMGEHAPERVQVSRLLRRSPHVLYTNVVEPILRWQMVSKGYALAHAACLQIDGQGLLITAQTDTGKTTTCLRSIREHGSRFVSDDMTIIAPDGVALCYPKPLTISAHTLKAASASPFPTWRRPWLQLQGRLHSKSGRRFALWLSRHNLPVATVNALIQMIIPPPKFAVERLIPGTETVVSLPISHMVVIERGLEVEEALGLDEACDVLEANTEDAYGFPPYHLIAPALTNGHAAVEASIRRDVLSRVSVTRIRTPDRAWFSRLPGLVGNPAIMVGEGDVGYAPAP